MAARAPSDSGP